MSKLIKFSLIFRPIKDAIIFRLESETLANSRIYTKYFKKEKKLIKKRKLEASVEKKYATIP